jgi:hypothetical protein
MCIKNLENDSLAGLIKDVSTEWDSKKVHKMVGNNNSIAVKLELKILHLR